MSTDYSDKKIRWNVRLWDGGFDLGWHENAEPSSMKELVHQFKTGTWRGNYAGRTAVAGHVVVLCLGDTLFAATADQTKRYRFTAIYKPAKETT